MLFAPPLVTPAQLVAHAPGQIWLDGMDSGFDELTLRGYRYARAPRVQPVRLQQHALVLYMGGHATITRRSGEREEVARVAPGDVSVQDHSWAGAWSWRGALQVLHLYLEPTLIERVATAVHGSAHGRLRDNLSVRDRTISQIGAQLVHEVREAQPGARILVRALAEQLAVHLVRHHFELRDQERAPEPLSGLRARKLRALFEENLSGDLSLATLAKVVGLGTHQLTRLFRATFGTTPHSYVMELRLDRARKLLLESRLALSEVAAACGFADQSHMTRLFTRRFGRSPRRYREAARE